MSSGQGITRPAFPICLSAVIHCHDSQRNGEGVWLGREMSNSPNKRGRSDKCQNNSMTRVTVISFVSCYFIIN